MRNNKKLCCENADDMQTLNQIESEFETVPFFIRFFFTSSFSSCEI